MVEPGPLAPDLLEVLVAGVSEPLFIADARTARIVLASDGVAALLGHPAAGSTVRSMTDYLVFLPDSAAWSRWVEELARHRHRRQDGRLRRRDGSTVPVAVSASFLRRDDREYVVMICQDLTARLAATEAMRLREVLFGTVLSTMSESVLVVDAQALVVHANPQSAAVLAVSAAQAVGMPLAEATRGVVDENGRPLPPAARPSARVLRTGRPVYGVVVGILPGPGAATGAAPGAVSVAGEPPVAVLPPVRTLFPVRDVPPAIDVPPDPDVLPVLDIDVGGSSGGVRWHVVNAAYLPATGGAVLTFTEVTTLKAQESRLQQMAWTDGLTGLPNRARLSQRLAAAEEVVGILYLDLDGFKEVNDVFGHTLGDRLLVEVASRLRAAITPADFVARFGGDEFVVVVPGTTRAGTTARAERLAAELCRIVAVPYVVDDHELVVSVSIGVTMSSGGTGGDAETWLQQADMALYAAKNAGRDTFRFFTSVMDVRMQVGARTVRAIRDGLRGQEFTVHLQPIASTAAGARPHAAECLLRWPRAQGSMPPEQFIPVAEDSGLIVALGSWVFDEAIRIWPTLQHLHPGGVMLTVNLSGRQLRWPGAAERLAAALERSGCDPALLAVEVTESSIIRDVRETTDRLTALTDLGVQVAIDDFGTGYSSLAHLLELPVDIVKIDRSFITGLVEDKVSRSIVAAVIDMAHGMGLQVIAEGVEQPAQLDFLRERGCHSYQGFLLGPPVPVQDFLREWGDPAPGQP